MRPIATLAGRLIYVHTIHDTGMEEKKNNGKVIIKKNYKNKKKYTQKKKQKTGLPNTSLFICTIIVLSEIIK